MINEIKPLSHLLDTVMIINLMLRSAVPPGQTTYLNFLDEALKIVKEQMNSLLLDSEVLHKHRFTKMVVGLYSVAMEYLLCENNKNQFKMTTQYYGPFYRSKNTYTFLSPYLEAFRFFRRVLFTFESSFE